MPCRDPDSVVLCLLAIDEEDEGDIALQIHFTLIQAFCCDNDINILRVSGMQRLAKVLGESLEDNSEPRDLHCILVTVSPLWCWGRGVGEGGHHLGVSPIPGGEGLYYSVVLMQGHVTWG